MLSGSPFNETHTNDPGYAKLYDQANATASGSALEKELLNEMQSFDFNEGGYIIPCYVDALDAYSTKIAGFRAAKIGQPCQTSTWSTGTSSDGRGGRIGCPQPAPVSAWLPGLIPARHWRGSSGRGRASRWPWRCPPRRPFRAGSG